MHNEYTVMMLNKGVWERASVSYRIIETFFSYDAAVETMKQVEGYRFDMGCPAEAYKVVTREISDWKDC